MVMHEEEENQKLNLTPFTNVTKDPTQNQVVSIVKRWRGGCRRSLVVARV